MTKFLSAVNTNWNSVNTSNCRLSQIKYQSNQISVGLKFIVNPANQYSTSLEFCLHLVFPQHHRLSTTIIKLGHLKTRFDKEIFLVTSITFENENNQILTKCYIVLDWSGVALGFLQLITRDNAETKEEVKESAKLWSRISFIILQRATFIFSFFRGLQCHVSK